MSDTWSAAQQHVFLARLAAGAACGAAALTAAYDAYFAFRRAPAIREMLNDFNVKLPLITQWVASWPWIPFVAALAALATAGLAWSSPRRGVLVCAYVLLFAALTLTLLAELAFFLPMDAVRRSITG